MEIYLVDIYNKFLYTINLHAIVLGIWVIEALC